MLTNVLAANRPHRRRRNVLVAAHDDAVFEEMVKPLSWQRPCETMKLLSDGYIPRLAQRLVEIHLVLRYRCVRANRKAAPEMQLESLIYQAASAKATDPIFEESVIRSYAEELAAKLIITLGPQFSRLGVKMDGQYEPRLTRELTQISSKLLILKCRIAASPVDYRFNWVVSGEALDRQRMKERAQSDGHREVKFCVTPMSEQHLVRGGRRVVHLAHVCSQWPAT